MVRDGGGMSARVSNVSEGVWGVCNVVWATASDLVASGLVAVDAIRGAALMPATAISADANAGGAAAVGAAGTATWATEYEAGVTGSTELLTDATVVSIVGVLSVVDAAGGTLPLVGTNSVDVGEVGAATVVETGAITGIAGAEASATDPAESSVESVVVPAESELLAVVVVGAELLCVAGWLTATWAKAAFWAA